MEDDGSEERVLRKLGFVGVLGTPMYYQGGSNLWLQDTLDKLGLAQDKSQESQPDRLKQGYSEVLAARSDHPV
jgi:hypothetical protein